MSKNDESLPSPVIGDPEHPVGPGVLPRPDVQRPPRPVVLEEILSEPTDGHPYRVQRADELARAIHALIRADINRYVHVGTNDEPVKEAIGNLAGLLVSVVR